MTPEMRAAYLTDLIGKKDMKQANEDYKKSWESVLDKLGEAQGELKVYKQLVSNQDTSQSSFSLGCKVAEDKIAYEREKK
jgi:hypothetical protein